MDFEAFAVSMAVKTAVWPADSEALIRMPAASRSRRAGLGARTWAAGAPSGPSRHTGTISPNEAAHGRPVQHGQTAQRAGLQAAAVAGHVCSVQS
eukprot:scaffold76196_cov36-Phaeocystis_antarctica.AAC.2